MAPGLEPSFYEVTGHLPDETELYLNWLNSIYIHYGVV